MARTVIWATCIAVCVSAIAYSTAIYNIEAAKQESFALSACVKAGGSWLRQWNNLPYCAVPKGQ